MCTIGNCSCRQCVFAALRPESMLGHEELGGSLLDPSNLARQGVECLAPLPGVGHRPLRG